MESDVGLLKWPIKTPITVKYKVTIKTGVRASRQIRLEAGGEQRVSGTLCVGIFMLCSAAYKNNVVCH